METRTPIAPLATVHDPLDPGLRQSRTPMGNPGHPSIHSGNPGHPWQSAGQSAGQSGTPIERRQSRTPIEPGRTPIEPGRQSGTPINPFAGNPRGKPGTPINPFGKPGTPMAIRDTHRTAAIPDTHRTGADTHQSIRETRDTHQSGNPGHPSIHSGNPGHPSKGQSGTPINPFGETRDTHRSGGKPGHPSLHWRQSTTHWIRACGHSHALKTAPLVGR